MRNRGVISHEVVKTAYEKLGIERISPQELGLMPYIQYIATNGEHINALRVNLQEDKILARWSDKKWINSRGEKLLISHEFWNAINELIFLAYVDI